MKKILYLTYTYITVSCLFSQAHTPSQMKCHQPDRLRRVEWSWLVQTFNIHKNIKTAQGGLNSADAFRLQILQIRSLKDDIRREQCMGGYDGDCKMSWERAVVF